MTQRQSQVNLLTINNFAKIVGTTPRTLRFYEQKGLLKPAKKDHWNSYRYYLPDQAKDFFRIKLLKNFDLTLTDIKSASSRKNNEDLLSLQISKLKKEVLEKQKEHQFLEKVSKLVVKDTTFKDLSKLESIGQYNLFCFSIEKGEYSKMTNYVRELRKVSKDLKLKCEDFEITFYQNSEYQPKNANLEMCLALKGNIPGKIVLPPGYYFKKISKARALVYSYLGPYDYFPLIYQKLFANLKNKKQVFEITINGPLNTKSKYDYLTKIGYLTP